MAAQPKKFFGQKFLETGALGAKGLKKIQKAGFADEAQWKASLGDGPQTKGTLASSLYKGPNWKPPGETPTEPNTDTSPTEANQISTGLVEHGVDTAKQGKDLLEGENESAKTLLDVGKQTVGQAQDFLGNFREQGDFAQDPRLGQRMQDLLSNQERQARSELDQYYATGEPARKARAEIAQNDVDAASTGMTGSLSSNQRQAAVERGLISDRAGAQVALGQKLRENRLGQIDQTRSANLGLANLYGNQGMQGINQGISAIGTGGGLGLNQKQIGAQIGGQGFDQQTKGVQIGSDLAQRDWENQMREYILQNQINQQNLGNIQGNKQNKYTRQQIEEMMGGMGGGFLGLF